MVEWFIEYDSYLIVIAVVDIFNEICCLAPRSDKRVVIQCYLTLDGTDESQLDIRQYILIMRL